MRIRGVRPQRSGVLFTGTLADAYRAMMWSRLASRVLMQVAQVNAPNEQVLYDEVRHLPWEDHISVATTMAVFSTGTNEELRNNVFTNARVKDAIVDRLREKLGDRPNVAQRNPDVLVHVVIAGERARISIDLSGDPLHERGYREPGKQVVAPMKETLAAAMLVVADWPQIAKKGGGFVDPMCGSGTLAIEAAMIAGDIAPGLLRTRWGTTKWLGHDEAAWAKIESEAHERRAAGMSRIKNIYASDISAQPLRLALASLKRANLEKQVALFQSDINDWKLPSPLDQRFAAASPGLIAFNPPYGERLAGPQCGTALCESVSKLVRTDFRGWKLAIIHPKPQAIAKELRMRPTSVTELYNGPIPAPVAVFDIY